MYRTSTSGYAKQQHQQYIDITLTNTYLGIWESKEEKNHKLKRVNIFRFLCRASSLAVVLCELSYLPTLVSNNSIREWERKMR